MVVALLSCYLKNLPGNVLCRTVFNIVGVEFFLRYLEATYNSSKEIQCIYY